MSYDKPLSDSLEFNFGQSSPYTTPDFNALHFDFLPPSKKKDITYKPPANNKLAFNFSQSSAYTPPKFNSIHFDFLPPASNGNEISPFGIFNPNNAGEPTILWTEFADPYGFDASRLGTATVRLGKPVPVFNFTSSQPYTKPSYESIRFVFGSGGAKGIVLVPAIDPGPFGLAGVKQDQPITGVGGFNASAIGQLKISNKTTYLSTPGIASFRSGTAQLKNKTEQLYPTGVPASLYGKPLIFNSKQFAPVQGRDQSLYGKPFMRGGVRWIDPSGLLSQAIGRPALLNTTANHYAYPTGIPSKTVFASPVITPHTIWARGILGTQFGNVAVIPALSIKPKGINSFAAGNTTIWYRVRPLGVAGFGSYETGYPKVFDPSQTFYPSPTLRSSVFGDVRIRNNNSYIKPAGIDSLAMSEWATIYPRNKVLYARSFVAQLFGDTVINNKSPSIFFNGLPAPAFPDHAIGYRIRKIAPTGFDHLKLGSPNVIKTPELNPNGLAATGFGLQWVSNYTRHIQNNSKDHSSAGVPVVWFRFRYVTPGSWQSSRFSSAATLTHGVREVIGKGFIQQGYGNAWVSRGVRLVQPLSIHKEYPSNHFVGRHQQISPLGFVATKFGTRIIPDIQALYPLGFTGVFGLASVDLSIRHLKTKGFATGGDQEALRWGWHTVYNKTQYIVQEFAGDNGLVPPKWSDWTAIANRNRVIRASGLSSQKIGYSQIDNNAAPLLPKGIEPPVSNNTMVAYAIRSIPADGIKPPLVSSWVVVYNDARVMNPKGLTHSDYGNAGVVNTRRYYRNIGRIDSLETGTPMIAYAIRTIDIEPRYSIAPPQINLPTVDLYTRYIGFQGYETARHGLASLSIHLRIIAPKWVHRDKAGVPALKNLTPELGVYGHNSDEYGRAQIRTQWREVIAQGDNSNVFGLLKIADTKQSIEVRGLQSGISSQRHTVTKTGTNPYVVQNIWLNNDSDDSKDGFGIPTDASFFDKQVPKPSLNQNVIYPEGRQSSKFGTIFMWSNNLMVDGGIGFPDNSVPNPMVSNKDRVVAISEGMDYTIEVSEGARLSPHTIYAVMDAPAQAIKNHKPGRLHYVNSNGGNRKPGEVFGRAFVESTIRTIKPRWSSPSSYYTIGRPTLTLSLAVVKPDSFRLSRFGIPSIPFTPQSIVVRAGVYDNVFGITGVKPPPYTGPQYINLKGIYSTVFGATYTDNYVRTLYARGGDSLIMGKKKSNDTPFMWQGLRIGEHVPLIIGGGDMALYGEHRISHWIQEVLSEGFESFRSEYSLESFYDRMTVKNADKKLPALLTINTASINPASAIGYQDVKYGQRYIRPDGNSNQYRKGAPSA
ncbi:hypothetical protein [Psychrobacter sp. AOP7-B1-24]|uniref:hypothetical protein n=1 Tax=Psychrobacter sp. AOP7-B1-24 TaxID=3457645 RepID=UPI00402B0BB5